MPPLKYTNGLLIVLLATQQSTTVLGCHAHAFATTHPAHAGFATRTHTLHAIGARPTPLLSVGPALRARHGALAAGVQQSVMLQGLATFPTAAMTLTAMPVLAHKSVMTAVGVLMTAAAASPLLFDALFAGTLYVLGKVTSGAIIGKKQTSATLNKWFVCGLVDGWACHAWYTFIELKFTFIASRVKKAIVMNSVSSAVFTPLYCAGFLMLLSLLEKKGILETTNRLQRDWRSLAAHSIKFWGVFNVPLFLFVPLHLRVAVSMGLHYVYLVGLAIWDAQAQTAAKGGEMANELLLPKEPETSETAWGTGTYDEGFGGAAVQPALNLAVAKVPIVDVDGQRERQQC